MERESRTGTWVPPLCLREGQDANKPQGKKRTVPTHEMPKQTNSILKTQAPSLPTHESQENWIKTLNSDRTMHSPTSHECPRSGIAYPTTVSVHLTVSIGTNT